MNAKLPCSLNLPVLVAIILVPCFNNNITQQQLIVEGFHPIGCGAIARTHLFVSTSIVGPKQRNSLLSASSGSNGGPRPFYTMILSSSSLSLVDETHDRSVSNDIIARRYNHAFDSSNTAKSAHIVSSREEEEEKAARLVLSSPPQQQQQQQKEIGGTSNNEKFYNGDKGDEDDLVRWVQPGKRKKIKIDLHSVINWAWTSGLVVSSVVSTITRMGGLIMCLQGLARMIRGASIAVTATAGIAWSNTAITIGSNVAASAVKMNNSGVIRNTAAANKAGVLVLFVMAITAVMLDNTLAAAVPSGGNRDRRRKRQPFSFLSSRDDYQSSSSSAISQSPSLPRNKIGRHDRQKIWSQKCDVSQSRSRRSTKKIWLEKSDAVTRGGSLGRGRDTGSRDPSISPSTIRRKKVVTDVFTVDRLEQGYTILDCLFGTISKLWMLKGLKRILLHHRSVKEIQVVMDKSISMAQRKQKEMRRLRRLTPAVTKKFIDDNPLNSAMTDIVKDKVIGEMMLPTDQFDIHFALIQIQASRIVVATCRGLMKFEPNDDRIQWLEDTASEYEAFRKSVVNVILTYLDGKGSAQTGGKELKVEYYG